MYVIMKMLIHTSVQKNKLLICCIYRVSVDACSWYVSTLSCKGIQIRATILMELLPHIVIIIIIIILLR